MAIGSEYKLGFGLAGGSKTPARVLALPVNPAAGGIDGGHDRKSLLGEGGAVEIVHEYLHQGGAVQVWQTGNFADYADVAEALDGLAILGSGRRQRPRRGPAIRQRAKLPGSAACG